MMDYKKHVSKSLSKFLQKEMNKRGLIKGDVVKLLNAKGLKANTSTLTTWIKETSAPSAYVILALADIFETSTDEVLGAYADYGEVK